MAEAVRGTAERFDVLRAAGAALSRRRVLRRPPLVLAMTWYAMRDSVLCMPLFWVAILSLARAAFLQNLRTALQKALTPRGRP